MMIFGRKRDSLRIRKVRAGRALFMVGDGTEEIEVQFETDSGDRLTLQIPHRLAPRLIGELTDSYEAINPPLSRRSNYQAGWDGAS